ncbi:hypothetical protein PPERSA_01895 [Pseudocohnilembus persalinus]|uniref:Uncharacterized protein n=1 Tax=Pseudocohnilembus persalinus TaxID=266149 RepID=A0A0V0R3S9_PSEPJ|nr:hypothetical protein PPERSA_01895 [Pseudocohnilembus persalinus]|eukprot:KRX09008.1 hypothetical protein PPERSA_01895 [Pseudocohnilembus persalinus]
MQQGLVKNQQERKIVQKNLKILFPDTDDKVDTNLRALKQNYNVTLSPRPFPIQQQVQLFQTTKNYQNSNKSFQNSQQYLSPYQNTGYDNQYYSTQKNFQPQKLSRPAIQSSFELFGNQGVISSQPVFVQKRSEVNSKDFFKKNSQFVSKYDKKVGLNTKLDPKFMKKDKKEKNYVDDHMEGFNNQKNVDLFNHLDRLFLKNAKNKFLIEWSRAEEQKFQQNLEKMKQQQKQEQEDDIKLFKQLIDMYQNQKKEDNDDKKQQISPENTQKNEKQFAFLSDINPVSIYKVVTEQYKGQKNKEKFQLIPKKTNINEQNQLEQPKIDQEQADINMVEEIFIHQILNFISKFGVHAMNQQDFKQFQRIVDQRHQILSNLEKHVELIKIVQIKLGLKGQNSYISPRFEGQEQVSDKQQVDKYELLMQRNTSEQARNKTQTNLEDFEKNLQQQQNIIQASLLQQQDKNGQYQAKSSQNIFASNINLSKDNWEKQNKIDEKIREMQKKSQSSLQNEKKQTLYKQKNKQKDLKLPDSIGDLAGKTVENSKETETEGRNILLSSKKQKKDIFEKLGFGNMDNNEDEEEELSDQEEIQSQNQNSQKNLTHRSVDKRPSNLLYENHVQKKQFKQISKKLYNNLHHDAKMEFVEYLIIEEIQAQIKDFQDQHYGKSNILYPHKKRVQKIDKAQTSRDNLKPFKEDFALHLLEAQNLYEVVQDLNVKDVFKKVSMDDKIKKDIQLIVKTNMRSGDIASIIDFIIERGVKNIQKQINKLLLQNKKNKKKQRQISEQKQKNSDSNNNGDDLENIDESDQESDNQQDEEKDLKEEEERIKIQGARFEEMTVEQKKEFLLQKELYEKKKRLFMAFQYGKKNFSNSQQKKSLMGNLNQNQQMKSILNQKQQARLSYQFIPKNELEKFQAEKSSSDEEQEFKNLTEEQVAKKREERNKRIQILREKNSISKNNSNLYDHDISKDEINENKNEKNISSPSNSQNSQRSIKSSGSDVQIPKASKEKQQQQKRKNLILELNNDYMIDEQDKKNYPDIILDRNKVYLLKYEENSPNNRVNFMNDIISEEQEMRAKQLLEKKKELRQKQISLISDVLVQNQQQLTQRQEEQKSHSQLYEILKENQQNNEAFLENAGKKENLKEELENQQKKEKINKFMEELKKEQEQLKEEKQKQIDFFNSKGEINKNNQNSSKNRKNSKQKKQKKTKQVKILKEDGTEYIDEIPLTDQSFEGIQKVTTQNNLATQSEINELQQSKVSFKNQSHKNNSSKEKGKINRKLNKQLTQKSLNQENQKVFVLQDGTITNEFQEGAQLIQTLNKGEFLDSNKNIVKLDYQGKKVIIKKAKQIKLESEQLKEQQLIKDGYIKEKIVLVQKKNSKGQIYEEVVKVKEEYEDVEKEEIIEEEDENGNIVKKVVKTIQKQKKKQQPAVLNSMGSYQSIDEVTGIVNQKQALDFQNSQNVFIPTNQKKKEQLNMLYEKGQQELQKQIEDLKKSCKSPKQSEFINLDKIKADEKQQLKQILIEKYKQDFPDMNDDNYCSVQIENMLDNYNKLPTEQQAKIQKSIMLIKKVNNVNKSKVKKQFLKKQKQKLENDNSLSQQEKQYLLNALEGGEAHEKQQKAEQEFQNFLKKKENISLNENGEYIETISKQVLPTNESMPNILEDSNLKNQKLSTSKKDAKSQQKTGSKKSDRGANKADFAAVEKNANQNLNQNANQSLNQNQNQNTIPNSTQYSNQSIPQIPLKSHFNQMESTGGSGVFNIKGGVIDQAGKSESLPISKAGTKKNKDTKTVKHSKSKHFKNLDKNNFTQISQKAIEMNESQRKNFFKKHGISEQEQEKINQKIINLEMEKQQKQMEREYFLQEMKQLAQTNQKTELQKILKKGYKLAEIKALINALIAKFGKQVDQESKYHLGLLNERKGQIENLQNQLNSKIESNIILAPDVSESFEKFRELRKLQNGFHGKRSKFLPEVFIPEKQKTGILADLSQPTLDTQALEMIIKFQDFNSNLEQFYDRLELFQQDRMFLKEIQKERKNYTDSVVKQVSLNEKKNKKRHRKNIRQIAEVIDEENESQIQQRTAQTLDSRQNLKTKTFISNQQNKLEQSFSQRGLQRARTKKFSKILEKKRLKRLEISKNQSDNQQVKRSFRNDEQFNDSFFSYHSKNTSKLLQSSSDGDSEEEYEQEQEIYLQQPSMQNFGKKSFQNSNIKIQENQDNLQIQPILESENQNSMQDSQRLNNNFSISKNYKHEFLPNSNLKEKANNDNSKNTISNFQISSKEDLTGYYADNVYVSNQYIFHDNNKTPYNVEITNHKPSSLKNIEQLENSSHKSTDISTFFDKNKAMSNLIKLKQSNPERFKEILDQRKTIKSSDNLLLQFNYQIDQNSQDLIQQHNKCKKQ